MYILLLLLSDMMVVGSFRGVWPSPQSLIVRFRIGFVPVPHSVIPCATCRIFSSGHSSRKPPIEVFVSATALEKTGDRLADVLRCVRPLGIDATLQALIYEPRVDRVDYFLHQRCLGEALLIATLTPIVFDVAVMAPDCRIFPVTRLLQEPHDLILGLRIQQANAKIPDLAIVHCGSLMLMDNTNLQRKID
jgi:hypothetical protein